MDERNEGLVYYGPHDCVNGCGRRVVRVATVQGGRQYEVPATEIYPNTRWKEHYCIKGDKHGVDDRRQEQNEGEEQKKAEMGRKESDYHQENTQISESASTE